MAAIVGLGDLAIGDWGMGSRGRPNMSARALCRSCDAPVVVLPLSLWWWLSGQLVPEDAQQRCRFQMTVAQAGQVATCLSLWMELVVVHWQGRLAWVTVVTFLYMAEAELLAGLGSAVWLVLQEGVWL